MGELNRTFHDKLHSRQMLTSIVANTFNYAVGRGLDLEQIKAATGLTQTDLINSESRLPEELFPTIWKLLGEAYPRQPLALHMASAAPFSTFGQLAQGVQYAEDIRSALRALVKYRSVLSDQLWLELIESGSEAILQGDHPVGEIDGGYGAEFGLALTKRLVQEILGTDDAVVRVEFKHEPFGSCDVYENFFDVTVCFQKDHNALVFRREALDLPTQGQDIHLFQYIQGNLDLLQDYWRLHHNPSQISALFDAIARNTELSEYGAETLAQQMNMSLRTLQRLVQEQGLTIRQLIDNAREARARQLLTSSTLSVAAISAQLGYSDERAFRRAFQRWTDLTPTEFRRRLGRA